MSRSRQVYIHATPSSREASLCDIGPYLDKPISSSSASNHVRFHKGFFTRDEEEVEFKGMFEGISDFVHKMMRLYSFDYDDLRDLELRYGVILAYCIKHGLDSAEEFVKSVAKFDVVQPEMTRMCRDPAAWNAIPISRLYSRAASVLMQGCEQFKAGRQEEFRKIKEDFEKPIPEPTAEIVYGELPRLVVPV